jgi:hypothetical protein
MRVTFDQACERASGEFEALRARAANAQQFEQAVSSMRRERFVCDTATGTTRSRDGVQGQFTSYDWGSRYDAYPNHVFYDFFSGFLLNKVSRIERGLVP